MSQNIRPAVEKLYLYKGKDESDDIYIESALHQHHIDGIRFLFKQFKSNKPGIILNNPHGYGNSLQVTLFLVAIQRLLKKPILILCDDGEEYNWFELFQKVIEGNNVVVNAPDPFVKKSIFIKNIDGLMEFTRRSWSIIVVDNDALLKMKTIQNKLEADYKIWITPVDIKEHLQTFTLIYKWIYPKETFNAEEFKGKPGDIRHMVSKSIQLSAFLKDIVFKTQHLTPFENPFENKVKGRQKVSEKNKDATGTKIKRSKRIIEDTITDKSNIDTGGSAAKISKVRNGELPTDNCSVSELHNNKKSDKQESDVMDIDGKHSDLDVETFISSKEPIKNHMNEFDNISNDSQENKTTMQCDSESILYERDTQTFICEDNNTKSNSTLTKDDISKNIMSQDSDDNAYELETQEFLNDNNMEVNDSENKYNIVEKSQNIGKPCGTNEITTSETKPKLLEDQKSNIEKESTGIDLDTSKQLSETNDVQEQIKDEENNASNLPNTEKIDENIVTEESQNRKMETKSKPSNIDSKITEHEDRIFKKFKGTFLDSIF